MKYAIPIVSFSAKGQEFSFEGSEVLSKRMKFLADYKFELVSIKPASGADPLYVLRDDFKTIVATRPVTGDDKVDYAACLEMVNNFLARIVPIIREKSVELNPQTMEPIKK